VEIRSGAGYPAGALSNFAPHPFVLEGLQINSMEGFLQGLKFSEPAIQESVFLLVGKAAKSRGARKNYGNTLWFKGIPFDRHSQEYQELLDEAYITMFATNHSAQTALRASGKAVLKHSLGRKKESETVLTRKEFCSRLTKIRDEILT